MKMPEYYRYPFLYLSYRPISPPPRDHCPKARLPFLGIGVEIGDLPSGRIRYLPQPSTATLPSFNRISPVPSKMRRLLFTIRPTTRVSSSSGTGLRKRVVNSTVTPQASGFFTLIARPMVSSRMAVMIRRASGRDSPGVLLGREDPSSSPLSNS